MFRYRVSLLCEALLWTAAMGWAVYLVIDIRNVFKTSGDVSLRSIFEFFLLMCLVWWPMIRTRIVHGYWMKDWDDTPGARTIDQQPNQTQHPR